MQCRCLRSLLICLLSLTSVRCALVAQAMASPIASFDTMLHADAVEFFPVQGLEDRLVCGTYQLQESAEGGRAEQQTRIGRLLVVRVEEGSEGNLILREDSCLDVPGVFDIKWRGIAERGGALLGHAAADGFLYTYRLRDRECRGDKEMLVRNSQVDCRSPHSTPGTLALSLDWNDRTGGCSSPEAAVSLSDGSLCVVGARDGADLEVLHQWQAHDMEAWITAWDRHFPPLLYSGADDGLLKLWDLRSGTHSPLAVCKSFDAGVTCLQSHESVEHCLVAGSYDEQIRVFDTRQLRRPVTTIGVGGGVWRVKWCPARNDLLLAACMHAGFTVLKYDHSVGAFDEGASQKYTGGHTSLGYGADWQSTGHSKRGKPPLVGTASFYDHLLQVWRISAHFGCS